VLLGDPPIDWDSLHSAADHRKWIEMRDTYPTSLIQREVLAKQRHALVVYGDMHFQRKNLGSNYDMTDPIAGTIVSLLEGTGGPRVFTIWTNTGADLQTLQQSAASWPKPSLTVLRGTTLGAADFTFYYKFAFPRLRIVDGKPDFSSPIPRDQWRSLRMEDQFDALLYLGPPPEITQSRLSPTLCSESGYLEMRLKRIALAGLPQAEADQLKQVCATQAGK